MSRKRWLALIAAAMLLVASIAVNSFATIAFSDGDLFFGNDQFSQRVIEEGSDISGTIVVLDVNGVIQDTGGATGFFDAGGYNHRAFLEQLDQAANDASVQGIILNVNTPGGGVVESAEIHQKILAIQEANHKPIYVSMGNMAASGGYYIAAPADKIIANPQTITGSIGVIMESINVAELAENYGVQVNTIKSGPYKDIMSPTREMTEEERDILQSIIDESYDEFVRVIEEGRGLSEERVRQLADGRIYTGSQAQEVGLVDELGSLENAIQLMKEELGADYSVIQLESQTGFYDIFSMTVQRLLGPSHELLGIEQLLTHRNSPTLKYLYTE
ncbi:signal peptide peptidase SppA [Halalkalibacterium ligniniphilum]|uniref:signal peptide peptidase SppA n=1 Tax=Halalkalibacterium ligniniphilum TaxID=1134413 RepID=UPI00034753FE|nr:signal peptide peptidase SppA [Halalkalibacterium ligniniphilum]